jgi:thymidylate kinase
LKEIKYWAFEGSDGTGKTTLSKVFAEQCNSFWTYEPNAELEELKVLRQMALTDNAHLTPMARECLQLANRSIHQKINILPMLDNKVTVVTDRSFLSGMVYAKLNGISFENFISMQAINRISIYPDIIIYVLNKDRKIDKNEGDIYDHASEDTHKSIDNIYLEAIKYIGNHKITKHIPILKFENDFKKTPLENVFELVNQIKKELK